MKKLVFDACSLIYLTKIEIKSKLPLLGEILVSRTVIKESTTEEEKFKEAKTIKNNLEREKIKESKIKIKNIFSTENLGRGEKEVIEICSKSTHIPVTDDQKAFNFALSLGLTPKTSEIILLDLLNENIITYEEFNNYFKKLAKIKLLKPEIINFFRKKAKTIIKTSSVKEDKEK